MQVSVNQCDLPSCDNNRSMDIGAPTICDSRGAAPRRCPVAGCDSAHNVDGQSDYHYLIDHCPRHLGVDAYECRTIRMRLNQHSPFTSYPLHDCVTAETSHQSPNPSLHLCEDVINSEQGAFATQQAAVMSGKSEVPNVEEWSSTLSVGSGSGDRREEFQTDADVMSFHTECTDSDVGDNRGSVQHQDNMSAFRRVLRPRDKLIPSRRWSSSVYHADSSVSGSRAKNGNSAMEAVQPNALKELAVCAAASVSAELANVRMMVGPDRFDCLASDQQFVQYAGQIIRNPISRFDCAPAQSSPIVYFCNRCVRMYSSLMPYRRHCQKCDMRRPPGEIIYRHTDELAVFEVDGAVETEYCRNVSVFARRFLEHKTVHEDVQPFVFYILAVLTTCELIDAGNRMEMAESAGAQSEQAQKGSHGQIKGEWRFDKDKPSLATEQRNLYSSHIPFQFAVRTAKTDNSFEDSFAGIADENSRNWAWMMISYFSRMKNSCEHNLSCLVVYPGYAGLSLGRMLIDLSYKISAVDDIIGTPERPLTDAGLGAYRSYWTEKIFTYLLQSDQSATISIIKMSESLRIHHFDVVDTLLFHGLIKNYRGLHVVLKSMDVMKRYIKKKERMQMSPDAFDWNVDLLKLKYTSKFEHRRATSATQRPGQPNASFLTNMISPTSSISRRSTRQCENKSLKRRRFE